MSVKIWKNGGWVGGTAQENGTATPGATEEQAAQIEANKSGIANLQSVSSNLQKKNTEQDTLIQANADAITDIKTQLDTGVVSGSLDIQERTYTVTLELADGSTETHVLETDDNKYPVKLTVNGAEIPWTVTGVR